jgi:hypothetical protein
MNLSAFGEVRLAWAARRSVVIAVPAVPGGRHAEAPRAKVPCYPERQRPRDAFNGDRVCVTQSDVSNIPASARRPRADQG